MNAEKILRGVIITGIFALPFLALVVVSQLYFPYITGKNFLFRVIVEIIFASWLGLAMLNREYRPQKSIVTLAVTVFVFVVALADLFGANPAKSFWSNFERMGGLITLLHVLALVVVTSTVLRSREVGLWFWRVSIAVASLVALATFAQSIASEEMRLFFSFGNPIYLAIYAVFHIFIALVLSARERAITFERVLLLLSTPLQLGVLYLTATRGASIGLVLGLLVAGIGIALSPRVGQRVRVRALVALLIVFTFVGGVFALKDTALIEESRLKRLTSISLSESNIAGRVVVWQLAWKGVKERPLLGWGQENFNLVFNNHYDPRLYNQAAWFDRTHNIVFDWLIVAGVLGLLAYISIFLAVLWILYRTDAFTIVQKWLLVGLLVAYSFHNLTVFDQVISYMLFAAILAWIVGRSTCADTGRVWHTRFEFTPSAGWVVASAIGALVLVYTVNAGPYQTNRTLSQGLKTAGTAELLARNDKIEEANTAAQVSLDRFKAATRMSHLGRQEVREQLTQQAGRFANSAWLSDEMKQQWYTAGVEALRTEEEQTDELDARFPAFLGKLHRAYGNYDAAREAYERSLAISPNKQTLHIELAAVEILSGNDARARELIKRAYELAPAYELAGVLYTEQLIKNGDTKAFRGLLDESPYLGTDTRVLNLLVDRNQHELAKEAWEHALGQMPKLNESAFALARVYAQRGEQGRVGQVLSRLVELRPDAEDYIRARMQENSVQ